MSDLAVRITVFSTLVRGFVDCHCECVNRTRGSSFRGYLYLERLLKTMKADERERERTQEGTSKDLERLDPNLKQSKLRRLIDNITKAVNGHLMGTLSALLRDACSRAHTTASQPSSAHKLRVLPRIGERERSKLKANRLQETSGVLCFKIRFVGADRCRERTTIIQRMGAEEFETDTDTEFGWIIDWQESYWFQTSQLKFIHGPPPLLCGPTLERCAWMKKPHTDNTACRVLRLAKLSCSTNVVNMNGFTGSTDNSRRYL
ncbi:hypothetical protein J6590_027015 [Homalodisca vitripennis]|nr:hypothetical protein J6590_027015 [Homalodisca vitripennis]